tara:strand:+ start:295 stop:474 length:180 start_codon:yes stop_codon:yes gene_type:complete
VLLRKSKDRYKAIVNGHPATQINAVFQKMSLKTRKNDVKTAKKFAALTSHVIKNVLLKP